MYSNSGLTIGAIVWWHLGCFFGAFISRLPIVDVIISKSGNALSYISGGRAFSFLFSKHVIIGEIILFVALMFLFISTGDFGGFAGFAQALLTAGLFSALGLPMGLMILSALIGGFVLLLGAVPALVLDLGFNDHLESWQINKIVYKFRISFFFGFLFAAIAIAYGSQ